MLGKGRGHGRPMSSREWLGGTTMAGSAAGVCDIALGDAKGNAESAATGTTLGTVAAARSWLSGGRREAGDASYSGKAVSSGASALGHSAALVAAPSVCGTVGRGVAASIQSAVACTAHGAAGAVGPGADCSVVRCSEDSLLHRWLGGERWLNEGRRWGESRWPRRVGLLLSTAAGAGVGRGSLLSGNGPR